MAGNIYVTQDSLVIQLSYTADIASSIASAVIKYENNETSGEWAAVHNAASKTVSYTLPKGSPLAVSGGWKFWIYATLTDGRVIPGTVVEHDVLIEGSE